MDNITRSALTALGLAGLVVFAAGSQHRKKTSIDWDAGFATATTAATSGTATAKAPDPALPDPKTDYKALDDAKLDGAKAYGKTILLRVWRGSTDPQKVTLFTCGAAIGASGFLDATYTTANRDLVKAIPPTLALDGECPRVVVKITGKQEYTSDLRGEIAQVMDVTPKAAETLPPGVDYVSMDDINFDGKKASGKIAQLKAYRGDTEEKKITVYPCGNAGGLNFLYVTFGPDQKELVKSLSSSVLSCQTIKVKLTSQQPYTSTWNAALIEVQKGE